MGGGRHAVSRAARPAPIALERHTGDNRAMRRLEFGWFLPTAGDTTAYGLASAQVAPSLEMFDRVVAAAEVAGFEYMLVPVQTACWEAWISSALMVGRSKSIRMLVAARPSYINPVLLAKMISTFDQLSGGRICINLIAGQSEAENASEGIRWGKEERYEIMDEEVSILKALWTTRGPVTYDGKFYQLKDTQIRPYPLQKPYPKFYLGGGSRQAWEISAKHSDVHLFWGDTYERIRANMAEIRTMAAKHDREHDIGFGMRLQIVCRSTEKEAWEFAHGLVGHASEAQKAFVRERFATSEANRRVRELAAIGETIEPHLWTGITQVRPGAGIAVVGDPEQCADTLQKFIDLGCHSFCLSGYLHDEEAERFGKWVMPILRERNRERMLAA
jgi:alkanesulfonate monooxygenase